MLPVVAEGTADRTARDIDGLAQGRAAACRIICEKAGATLHNIAIGDGQKALLVMVDDAAAVAGRAAVAAGVDRGAELDAVITHVRGCRIYVVDQELVRTPANVGHGGHTEGGRIGRLGHVALRRLRHIDTSCVGRAIGLVGAADDRQGEGD